MATVRQRVRIAKKKNGKSKGVMIKKSSGLVVINKDGNGNVVSVTKQQGKIYVNGQQHISEADKNKKKVGNGNR